MTKKNPEKNPATPQLFTLDKTVKMRNEVPGSKSLQMMYDVKDKTMADISPFAVQRALENIAGPEVQAKMLRDGSLLIEAKDLATANKLIQITSILSHKIKVIEDARFNSIKGVIYAPALLVRPITTRPHIPKRH